MLQLSKAYSNRDSVFETIEFRVGLNVVYANVTHQQPGKKSSHSIGKTKLAEVLDYLLLKEVGPDFFLRKKDAFTGFRFFLEVKISDSSYVTIERIVNGKIFLYSSSSPVNVLSDSSFSIIGEKLGVRSAKLQFDALLGLDVVSAAGGSNYRNGLRYCIRKQDEYQRTFQVKNVSEKDRVWKPYLCGLLGLDPSLVSKKYNAKADNESLKNAIKQLRSVENKGESSASLEARLSLLQRKIEVLRSDAESFSFQKADSDISKELVDNVASEISDVNQKVYVEELKVADLRSSLDANFDYEIGEVKELFESIEVTLPDQLVVTFDELAELNRKMSAGRKEHLEKALERSIARLAEYEGIRSKLSATQAKLSRMLVEKESFQKYKNTQNRLVKMEAEAAVLKEQRNALDSIGKLEQRLQLGELEEAGAADELMVSASKSHNTVMRNIASIFEELIDDILGIDAYLYFDFNKDGNPTFRTRMLDGSSLEEGHSYNKVMAACLDIALLANYSNAKYFRFAYHDGLFESLDDRVKLRLLEKWRSIAESKKLQLMLTVLDTDVPRDQLGSKVHFENRETILELHDRGTSGRLFKMPIF